MKTQRHSHFIINKRIARAVSPRLTLLSRVTKFGSALIAVCVVVPYIAVLRKSSAGRSSHSCFLKIYI